MGPERSAGLGGLGSPYFARRHRFDAMRRQQVAHLDELAGIVGRDDQLAGDSTMHACSLSQRESKTDHATAIFCRSTRRATPLRASAISARNSSSENGDF